MSTFIRTENWNVSLFINQIKEANKLLKHNFDNINVYKGEFYWNGVLIIMNLLWKFRNYGGKFCH